VTDPLPTELTLGDLQAAIRHYEQNMARSLQVEIGPSQVGEPCDRRLVLQLLGAEEINRGADRWPATVGTAVHELLAKAFTLHNTLLVSQGKPARWLVEQEIMIRPGLIGHTDLIDLWSWTVIDHKNVSVASLRKYRKAGHPGQQYEAQAHLYGLGWARAGLPIKRVAIAFYPKSGMQRDSWLWTVDYDEQAALAALARMDWLLAAANEADMVNELDQYLRALPRDTGHCDWCPYHSGKPAPADDPAAECAGLFEDPAYDAPARPAIAGIF
jgi:hypothetical protein